MTPRPLAAIPVALVGLALVAAPAQAHFKLEEPADWIVTDETGDPQKLGPCGSSSGKASKKVTRVVAGSTLHVKVTETVGHGGHYRVALASDPSELVDPETVIENGACVSATIQDPPVAPVIADGLFEHTQAKAESGKVWETDVTIPSDPCPDCTLQILEFMTPHGAPCYYYHCAKLEIVAAEDGADAGGGGTGGAAPAPSSSDGCSVGRGTTSGLSLVALAFALAFVRRRRR